jgi:hypothetical protein
MDLTRAQALFPARFVADVRNSVIFTAVLRTAFSFLEGLCCSPSGHRLVGGVQGVATSAQSIARLAAKSGAEKAIQRVVAHARQTDDDWNSVVACGSAAALFSMDMIGPTTAASYGLHAAADAVIFDVFLDLFRLDHRFRLPERPARYAAAFPGFPATSIVVEELSADEYGVYKEARFPDKDQC